MTKKTYRLTKTQGELLEGLTKWAKESGLEIKTMEGSWNKQAHKEISKFLRTLDRAYKNAANSTLVFRTRYNTYSPTNSSYQIA